MILCPIAYWKQQRPESVAIADLTYLQLNALIQKLCCGIGAISENVLAFVPRGTVDDVALFFAAWRMGKAVYPLSFRLPKQAIDERVKLTGARLVDPSDLYGSTETEIESIDENCLATLIETSSAEKIVCHLFKSHLSSGEACVKALNIGCEDTYCLNLPLCHISGIALMLRCFLAGATLVFAQHWKEATHISMVPTQLFRLLENRERLPKLKCLLVGGAPLSKGLYTQALAEKLPVYCSYGMTETASAILLNTAVLPHIQLKLAEDGEVLVKGPSLFQGYFGKEERNPEDWFETRDLGRMNEEGEIEIVGRKDRQFISGGENIIPEEIEKSLLALDGIIEARVTPEVDEEFGMVPTAQLYCKKEIPIHLIQKKLEEILPRFKIPKKITVSLAPFPSKQTQLSLK